MITLLFLTGFVLAAIVIGFIRPSLAAASAAIAALAAAGLAGASWTAQTIILIDRAWLPSLGSRFVLAFDPLGTPLIVFVTGVAVTVFAFTAAYMPRHLEEEQREARAIAQFVALLLAFMLAMTLLILAQDLLVMFVALELTALASFLLIRFDRRKVAARRAALTALVVTGSSSLLFLSGALLVSAQTGTTVLTELMDDRAAADISPVAVACLILGVIGKSAQAPLHFWLPKAMIAPTPVSAYLHSATLVAAGVFVLQRLRFLLESAPPVLDGLLWLAFLSIGVGALLALVTDEFKRILAYSTVAQYGYAVALVAIGGSHGAVGAPFFLVAHGLAKCALFMAAGAVTTTTGEDRLSRSGGLARAMPLLAGASAVAAAGLAGLPLTIGYLKDDLFIQAALDRDAVTAGLAAAAVALTIAYSWRFWFGIFGGPRRDAPRPTVGLTAPVVGLAALVLLGGLWPAPLEPVFTQAGSWIAREAVSVQLGYHLELGPLLWVTLGAWGAGAMLALGSNRLSALLRAPVSRLSKWLGPAALAQRIAAGGVVLSQRLHRLEVRDMRDRIAAILIPTGAFVLLGLLVHPDWPAVGRFGMDDVPAAAALALVAVAAFAVTRPLKHLSFVLMLSFVGFSLSLAFALFFAPNVALVLALIETAFTLLFLAVLAHIRRPILEEARRRMRRDHGPVAGTIAGCIAAITAWQALSMPRPEDEAIAHIALSEQAHAKDVVTAILADFRGLDTAGELTVLVVAMFGAAAIMWGRRA